MALEYRDRVVDTTTTTGTGTLTLAGSAPTGFRDFTAHTTGATVRFLVATTDNSEWEVSEGVWTSSGATLTRVTVYASSNAGSLVNFSAGTKTVSRVWTAADAPTYAGCMAYNSAAQSAGNSSSTLVTFDSEAWDTASIHSTSTNTGRFTVPSGMGGHWQFSWSVQFDASASGQRIGFLRKNGGTDANNVRGSIDRKAGSSSVAAVLGKNTTVEVSDGDYIELYVYQDSGGTLNFGATSGGVDDAALSVMEARFLG